MECVDVLVVTKSNFIPFGSGRNHIVQKVLLFLSFLTDRIHYLLDGLHNFIPSEDIVRFSELERFAVTTVHEGASTRFLLVWVNPFLSSQVASFVAVPCES